MNPTWFLAWIIAFPLAGSLFGLRIKGRVPKQGALIIAANHVSFLDPPLIGIAAFRETFFLAKQGLFRVSPFFRWLITNLNALQVHGTEGMIKAVQLLRRGEAVAIFPEGTRSRIGHMLPFNPGIGYLAITQKVPVVPTLIVNSNRRVASLMCRFHTLEVRFGEPVNPDGFGDTKEEFQRFADRIREEVLKLR